MDPVVVFMMSVCLVCLGIAVYVFVSTVIDICSGVAEVFLGSDDLDSGY